MYGDTLGWEDDPVPRLMQVLEKRFVLYASWDTTGCTNGYNIFAVLVISFQLSHGYSCSFIMRDRQEASPSEDDHLRRGRSLGLLNIR